MSLKDIGEFGFIDKIKPGCLNRPDRVIQAIGDDAAAFVSESDKITLVTTDLLVEKVHFSRDLTSGFNLGFKALGVNLSDIAAMGGYPENAFVSIGIPATCSLAYLEDIYRGIKSLASEYNVNILGGDTTSSKSELLINIAVIGSVNEKEILYRHTAKPGDLIVTTGFLGDSRAGLHLLLNHKPADESPEKNLVHAHLLPRPFIREGRFLASQIGVNAAIDISDGLSSDLGHMIQKSSLGANIYETKIPVSSHLKRYCLNRDLSPLEFALHGGEDYTLLCSISPDRWGKIAAAYLKQFGCPLYFLGEMTDQNKGMTLIDEKGMAKPLHPGGWDHFSRDSDLLGKKSPGG